MVDIKNQYSIAWTIKICALRSNQTCKLAANSNGRIKWMDATLHSEAEVRHIDITMHSESWIEHQGFPFLS